MNKNETIYGALAVPYQIKKDNTKKFLLLKHIKGYWTFPGGGKDPEDSSLVDTLIRELKEEIGITVLSSELVHTGLINKFIYDTVKPERAGKTGETHFYILKLNGSEKFSSFDKIADFGWFSASEVLEKLPYENEQKIFSQILLQLS